MHNVTGPWQPRGEDPLVPWRWPYALFRYSEMRCLKIYIYAPIFFPAGQNVVNVWDLLSGGRLVHSLSNHQKTITDMCFDSTHSRLLTASLDQHIKVYNVTDYKVTHSMKYPAPLLSVALSPDDTYLVAGMNTGLLSIRRRIVHSAEQIHQRSSKVVHGGTFRYYMRGQGKRASQVCFFFFFPLAFS